MLEDLVAFVAERMGFQSSGEMDQSHHYSKPYLYLSRMYESYHLMVGVQGTSGVTYFGTERGFTAAEMLAYLRGILNTLDFVKSFDRDAINKKFSVIPLSPNVFRAKKQK